MLRVAFRADVSFILAGSVFRGAWRQIPRRPRYLKASPDAAITAPMAMNPKESFISPLNTSPKTAPRMPK